MNIEIFGKQNCGYCVSAKNLLTNKNIPYTYTDFFEELTEDDQTHLRTTRAPTASTFPMIFIDDTYIGGFSNLDSILK